MSFSFVTICAHNDDLVGDQLDKVVSKVSLYARKKYNLITIGTGVSAPGDELQRIGISFQTNHQITKDRSKEILIDLTLLLKNSVNENKILLQNMKNPPFKSTNASINIFFVTEDRKITVHPQFAVVSLSSSEFEFATNDIDPCKYKTITREPFDDIN